MTTHPNLPPEEPTPQSMVSLDTPGFEEVFHSRIVGTDGLTLRQVDMRLRMQNVMQALSPRDRHLLSQRHIELLTLDEIAAEEGITRQSVLKRLERAEQNLRRAFAVHWLDPVDMEDLDG